MTKYINHHYVPEGYQRGFLPTGMSEQKFRYLDLHPEPFRDGRGNLNFPNPIKRWGPAKCFYQEGLYDTEFGGEISKEIETKFFGDIDDRGKRAIDFWARFEPMKIDPDAYRDLIAYMIMQKLRTPKALTFLSSLLGSSDKNKVLALMQQLQGIYGAVWSEAEWAIADATESDIKFIISDHPVTMYNPKCPPGARMCAGGYDPDPRLNGSFTVFPLTMDKLLILTNKSWVRNPYGDPLKPRPNPRLDRPAVFNFTTIQTGRKLSSEEVTAINYVIKQRAFRYIAAPVEEWLYPERSMPTTNWASLGDGLLFMPDPRAVTFGGEIIMGGFPDGRPAEGWDEYGRRPGQRDFKDPKLRDQEWVTFQAFKGEFARLHGPKYRGSTISFRGDQTEADEELHRSHLECEKVELTKRRVGRRTPIPLEMLRAKKSTRKKQGVRP